MGSVTREIVIEAPVEAVWAAVGDFATGPLRTTPGFFTDCRLESPGVRALTFADGTVVRERLVARDEDARRIVWAWLADEVMHDNTSMQVFAEGPDRSRLVWIHDTLPDELTTWLSDAMDAAVPAFQAALTSPSG